MAITLPTFRNKEILTAGKLMQLVQAISAKLAAITGADLTWDLVCGGNIDFDNQYGILGLRKFWNVINVSEYPEATALEDAKTELESMGGGVLYIPPDTTITSAPVSIDSNYIAIIGGVPSSVLKLQAG